ncbi:conserved membrane hypothetical protein [Burkholderiales bacterium]|nr:conserved membrane hypothetical protein [Burkholderiales bacterium]
MLSFEQAPPLSASFRFFLTAPWFGVAAGLLLAWEGPEALLSRWSPPALALTHLLTAGFLLQAMCGALLQFIPVATGANVWRPLLIANFVHPALLAGALLLALSLARARTELLPAAEALLGVGLGAFCAVCGLALLRTTTGMSLPALRTAIAALAVTTVLGLLLAQAYTGRLQIALPALTDLHAAWGLGGWALVLLAGVSFTVVPMFQMTPPYPPWLPRLLPATLALALAAASVGVFASAPSWLWSLAIALAAVPAVAFALVTLRLQQRRRRARTDATFAFFRGAMIMLLAAAAACLASSLGPEFAQAQPLPVVIGVLCLVGVFVSAVSGMLYKIVPFIATLKLPHRAGSSLAPPSIKMFIPERSMVAQMRLHFAALALLLACLAIPQLTRLAGVAFALSCAWLGTNLLRGLRVYVALRDQIRADAAVHGS